MLRGEWRCIWGHFGLSSLPLAPLWAPRSSQNWLPNSLATPSRPTGGGERGCPVLHSMRDETSQAVEQTKMREAVALVLVHSGTELWHKAVVFAEEGSQAPTVRD